MFGLACPTVDHQNAPDIHVVFDRSLLPLALSARELVDQGGFPLPYVDNIRNPCLAFSIHGRLSGGWCLTYCSPVWHHPTTLSNSIATFNLAPLPRLLLFLA